MLRYNEEYIKAAVGSGVRADGRLALECREMDLKLARAGKYALAECKIGNQSRALSISSCDHLESPRLQIQIHPTVHGVDVYGIRKLITESIDTKALQLFLRVDIFILEINGNAFELTYLAGIASLRQHASLQVPLRRAVVPVSIAIFKVFKEAATQTTYICLLDPTKDEEAQATANLAVSFNRFGQITALSKPANTFPLPLHLIHQASSFAPTQRRASFLHTFLDTSFN